VRDKNTFENDIERAERATLMFSWLGAVSALVIIGYSIWGIM